MRTALLALLLLPALAAAQAPPDSLRTLPEFGVPVSGDFRPPQTSAARAYLYSAAATGVLVGVGYLVDRAAAAALDPTTSDSYLLDVGGFLMAAGVIGGPMVGNLSLGAGADVRRGAAPKLVGIAVGGSLVLAGTLSALACIPAQSDGCGGAAGVLVVGGAVVGVVGLAVGTVYDLATIPGNARWARRARANGNRVPVALAPGYDARADAPVLTLRVGL